MPRIRWGILSTAKIARELVMPAIQLSRNGELAALASRDPTKGSVVCERFGITNLYSSYEDLLAAPEVDAIYIPLPNTMHVEWARKAMEAGKHVLCEKPLSMNAGEVTSLIEMRDKQGVIAGEAFMVVHHPQWQMMRDLVAAGRLGKLRVVEASFAYDNRDAANIRNRRELGGGGLRDIGVYPVVCTRFATSKEPTSATARIDWDPEFRTDRFASCWVDFEDFYLSFYCGTQAARRQHMTFHGEKGWARLDAPFNSGIYDQASVTIRMNDATRTEQSFYPQANHYVLMVENFADAIAGKGTFAFPLESSRSNQRVIDMLFAAAASSAE
jgi:predicted dehydrogenase